MLKVKVGDYLSPDQLGAASEQSPFITTVKQVRLIPAADVPFPSSEDRYELSLDIDNELVKWLPNNTSLRAFIEAFGNDGDAWTDHKIKLWWVTQKVQGSTKKVIYGDVVALA